MIKVKKATPRKYKRVVIGGEQGTGKTTLAYNWSDNPLWIDLDKRIPEDIIDNCTVIEGIKDFESLKKNLKEIKDEDGFEYDSVVLDTMTIAESFARSHSIMHDYNGREDNYADYSKGDKNHLPTHINTILSLLEKIAEKHECDIILLCHSEVKPIKNPNGENYDKAILWLTSNVRNRVLQWADLVGFIWAHVEVKKEGMTKKATGSDIRKISFRNNPRFDAKGPAGLPGEMDLDKEGLVLDEVRTKKGTKSVSKPAEIASDKPLRPKK